MSGYLGIIDWGIGGLGVFSALRQKKHIPTLYFSDSGHTPYGKTEPSKLEDRLGSICDFLRQRGAGPIAIACNAANAAYADREGVSGIIAHGVKALQNGGWKNVGLIAGRGTVVSNVYENMLAGSQIKLHQRVAQPLSAYVEAGTLDGDDLHADLEDILNPISRSEAILMACTHYPVIENEIRAHVDPQCQLVDPAEIMADWIVNNWQIPTSDKPDIWFTTGDTSQFKTSGKRAFNVKIDNVNPVSDNLTCTLN